jgi:hypothetical protein
LACTYLGNVVGVRNERKVFDEGLRDIGLEENVDLALTGIRAPLDLAGDDLLEPLELRKLCLADLDLIKL